MRSIMAVLISFCVLLSGCASNTDTVERGDKLAPCRVLVAGPRSEFKRKVMDQVAARLGMTDYYFKITDLDGLGAEDVRAYGAVVVVYSMPAGKMDDRVKSFLEKNPKNPKVIVFYTKTPKGDRFGTEEAVAGEDQSITLLAYADQYAEQLAALIKKRFE